MDLFDLIMEFVDALAIQYDEKLAERVISEYATSGSIITAVTPAAELLLPIGLCLLALRWTADLFTRTLKKDFNIEDIFRTLLRLVIGVMILTNALSVIAGIDGFVTELLKEIQSQITVSGDSLSFLKNYLEDLADKIRDNTGVKESITLEQFVQDANATFIQIQYAIAAITVEMLLPSILSLVISIAAYTRALRLSYKVLYAPIAMSDIYQGGMRSGAASYAKEVFAIFFEPVITYLTVTIGMKLISIDFIGAAAQNALIGTLSTAYPYVVLLTICYIIFKSKDISREIIM